MLNSLNSYLRAGDELIILVMDETARAILKKSFARQAWRVISIDDLADEGLMTVFRERPAREFFWTCTPALISWVVNQGRDGDLAVYLDADMMFFDDPHELFKELGDDGTILIHEHRFSRDKTHLIINGRFNVGMVAFRIGDEARRCVARWRTQTIENCSGEPLNGQFADQGYLNEWPELYAGCRVLRHLGGGLAPWNVNQYRIAERDGHPIINDEKLIFYHYHALRTIDGRPGGLAAIVPAKDYRFGRATLHLIYEPYAALLKSIEDDLAKFGTSLPGDETRSRFGIWFGAALGYLVRASSGRDVGKIAAAGKQ